MLEPVVAAEEIRVGEVLAAAAVVAHPLAEGPRAFQEVQKQMHSVIFYNRQILHSSRT